MKLSTVAAVLGLAAPAFSYTSYKLSYNTTYDRKDVSLHSVTCSTGEHGLLTRGYKTLGDLPTYPNIGGVPQITSGNTRYCGSCWELTYTDSDGAPMCVNFTAIDTNDHTSDGFTISLDAMDKLTGGKGKKLKTVPITAQRKPPSWCGLQD